MNKQELYQKFLDLQKKLYAYQHAMMLVNWDGSTFAPSQSVEGRSITSSILAGESHNILTSEETGDLLNALREEKDLSEVEKRTVDSFYRDYRKQTCIPADEVMAYAKLRSQSESVWVEAKKNNDFASFAPFIEKLVDYTKRFSNYYNDKDRPFNVLLDDYQEGLTMETLDKFFAEVKKSVVPLNDFVASSKKLQKVKEIKQRIDSKTFDAEKQKKLINNLFKLQGLDPSRCKIAESEHPFTSGTNSKDIRYTVHYHEDNLASSIYSGLHEGGHAMYQLNINDDFNYTSIYDGASMSMHESQSRIYENNIGRSYEFSKHIYKEVKKLFPKQYEDISEEDFYFYCNYSSPSLIRVEADELTYSLHIMVRYQIEKMIFEDGIDVMELPAIWNKLYNEYLGITPPNDTKGILQDVHWSFGLFGYFPTYALGTAYSAQFEATMKRSFNYEAELRSGDLTKITEWLKENVHKYGSLYRDEKILKMATGEEFNPSYYTKYLDEKYRKIYS